MNFLKKHYSKLISDKKNELNFLNKLINENQKYFDNISNDIKSLLFKQREIEQEINAYLIKLEKIKQEYDNMYKEVNKFSITYVDSLEGLEFENYIVDLLSMIGFSNVINTKASNDYGVDITAEKENIKYAIQCKNYNKPIGNDCVQEVYCGKQYYNCHVAVVITNSTFTKNAIELAKKSGVLLWDRDYLIKLLEQYAIIVKTEMRKKGNDISNKNHGENEEPLYNEIVKFVVEQGKASTPLLQRRFRLGYNRAARCIDLLEERGIIGPNNGSKPREVLVRKDNK